MFNSYAMLCYLLYQYVEIATVWLAAHVATLLLLLLRLLLRLLPGSPILVMKLQGHESARQQCNRCFLQIVVGAHSTKATCCWHQHVAGIN